MSKDEALELLNRDGYNDEIEAAFAAAGSVGFTATSGELTIISFTPMMAARPSRPFLPSWCRMSWIWQITSKIGRVVRNAMRMTSIFNMFKACIREHRHSE